MCKLKGTSPPCRIGRTFEIHSLSKRRAPPFAAPRLRVAYLCASSAKLKSLHSERIATHSHQPIAPASASHTRFFSLLPTFPPPPSLHSCLSSLPSAHPLPPSLRLSNPAKSISSPNLSSPTPSCPPLPSTPCLFRPAYRLLHSEFSLQRLSPPSLRRDVSHSPPLKPHGRTAAKESLPHRETIVTAACLICKLEAE